MVCTSTVSELIHTDHKKNKFLPKHSYHVSLTLSATMEPKFTASFEDDRSIHAFPHIFRIQGNSLWRRIVLDVGSNYERADITYTGADCYEKRSPQLRGRLRLRI